MKVVRLLPILIILLFSTTSLAEEHLTDIKIYPSITNSNLSVNYQEHRRYYHLSGTAVMRFDGYVASSPEYYDFEYWAIFNWVTGGFRQGVILKKDGKELTVNGGCYSFEKALYLYPLDPLLYHKSLYCHCYDSSLLDYEPFAESQTDNIIFYNTLNDHSYALMHGYPSGLRMLPYIFSKESTWHEQIYRNAKRLRFTNAQDQYITKGSTFIFTAQQYIPGDIYNGEDDHKIFVDEDWAVTNLPIMFYGTKARLRFQYLDDLNSTNNDDAFSPVAFSRDVNMHGNSLIYALDTSNMRTGKWQVTAQITKMGDYSAIDYPVTEPLYFTVNQKFSLWDGFNSNLIIDPLIDYHDISFEALLPEGQETFKYLPFSMPVIASTFADTLPLGLDAETQDINIGLPDAAEPIDVYLGFSIPAAPQIYLLYPDNSLHPVDEGLRPWKSNVTEIINETVIDGEEISALPKGTTIDAYILVTPHNDLSKYYFWKTFVVTNH